MVLVCGEALMDVFALADTPTGVALEARVGGSPFNVAIGLARLGQAVAFFGAVSRGFLGERLMRALNDEGSRHVDCTRVDAPTTLGLVGLDARGVPSYAFYGEGGADRQLAADALGLAPPALAALHVGSFATVGRTGRHDAADPGRARALARARVLRSQRPPQCRCPTAHTGATHFAGC